MFDAKRAAASIVDDFDFADVAVEGNTEAPAKRRKTEVVEAVQDFLDDTTLPAAVIAQSTQEPVAKVKKTKTKEVKPAPTAPTDEIDDIFGDDW